MLVVSVLVMNTWPHEIPFRLGLSFIAKTEHSLINSPLN